MTLVTKVFTKVNIIYNIIANLYGQVSCDYAVSQLLTVVHIDLGKSQSVV